MPCFAPKASAVSGERDPTATSSASSTYLVASANLPAMFPVLRIPQRVFVPMWRPPAWCSCVC
jgi:hypothetical protein